MKRKENSEYIETSEMIEEEEQPLKKKQKRFAIKEFRNSLKEKNISDALQTFHDLCFVSKQDRDHVLAYLKSGGSCLELLQLMEVHTDVCHLILEIVYFILLEINSKYPQYTSNAHEGCRYFLSTYITMANKMLSLNSTRVERIPILKFLTAVVALSPNFAKDILIHININSTNLGFLTNTAYSKDAVRYAFINFLMAFLVDGYYPTISALLEKRGLLTSILKGSVYDDADIVCVVINTLKTHILENPLVSKTVKMRTFSTPVVKDIVQLYNWKGPVQTQKNSKKKKADDEVVTTDPLLKSKVNECVHDFLLILCTSHKYGVIFKDPQLGLGKKGQNSLVYTVLNSLDTPWKNLYAGELVIKICGACPDLTKTIWANLRPSLEPRRTQQWLSALNFTQKVFAELKPSSVEYAIKELTPQQLAQVTQILIAPTQILKILRQDEAFSDKYLKHHVLKTLLQSLKSIELYLDSVKKIISPTNFSIYDTLIKEHLERNFPNSTLLLENYKAEDDDVDDFDHLDVVLQTLSIYQRIYPNLLDFTDTSVNLKDFLGYASEISKNRGIEMRIVQLYLDQDPVAFLPNTELFEQVIPHVVDCYCRSRDDASYKVMEKMCSIAQVFEGSEKEIRIWIGSLTNLEEATESVGGLFINALRMAFEKSYFSELSDIRRNLPESKEDFDVRDQIEQLCNDPSPLPLKPSPIKHINLSPFVLALLEYLSNTNADKSLKTYLNYAWLNLLHAQTDPDLILHIVRSNNCNFLSKSVLNYFATWSDANSRPILSNSKGKIRLLAKFSSVLTGEDSAENFLKDSEPEFSDDIFNLLNMSCFYIVNLARRKQLDRRLLENCLHLIRFCTGKGLEVNILSHPVLHHYFSPLQIEKENSSHALITNFLLDVITASEQNDDVLDQYKEKLFNSVCRMFRKASKYKNVKTSSFMNAINTVGFSINHALVLFEQFKEFDAGNTVTDDNTATIFVHIATYLLNMLNNLENKYENILDEEVTAAIATSIVFLISKHENLDVNFLIKSFTTYLEVYPHLLDHIPKQLFVTILQKEEYSKECVDLAILLLRNDFDHLFADVMKDVDKVTSKKGVIMPIIDLFRDHDVSEENLRVIYEKIEHVLHKALQKPQKAGQHFEKFHKGVDYLISKFFTFEKYKTYIVKIHKYETLEVFHVHLLKTIFSKASDGNQQYLSNAILTYIHLCLNFFKRKSKTDEDWIRFDSAVDVIKEFLLSIAKGCNSDVSQVGQNESFKLFCKFCLKFGVSGHPNLLSVLSAFVGLVGFKIEDSQPVMEMLVSHSEFLERVLEEESVCKVEILCLMRELFRGSEELMTKEYMPILLAAYRATLRKSDRIIFTMLKMFEVSSTQSSFYDFNPFLWGKAAANHYSIRSDVQKALWRQPRVGSVLDILEEHRVLDTVKNYPPNISLDSTDLDLATGDNAKRNIYDLTFLIPLFALLLAPENAVQTYRFTKSGALTLTITALSSEDRSTRSAACFVLSRFYHHVEARQTGKDNQLWLRFVEAICKGLASIDEEDLKLNRFASVFLARMALILTQPTHIMYVPLSQYLLAKSTLDFRTIPELYTLLHSADVNFKEHRNFILEVLRDGLISPDDFHVALRSVSFKLIMEQYNSVLSDGESKLLTLEVVERATRLEEGCKLLSSSYGLLSWLYHVVLSVNKMNRKHVLNIFNIMYNIVSSKESIDFHVVTLLLGEILDNISDYNFTDDVLLVFLKVSCKAFKLSPEWLSRSRLETLISAVNCAKAGYILKYGLKHIHLDEENLNLDNEVTYFVESLTCSWLKNNP